MFRQRYRVRPAPHLVSAVLLALMFAIAIGFGALHLLLGALYHLAGGR